MVAEVPITVGACAEQKKDDVDVITTEGRKREGDRQL
jgi:hypothetical protein